MWPKLTRRVRTGSLLGLVAMCHGKFKSPLMNFGESKQTLDTKNIHLRNFTSFYGAKYCLDRQLHFQDFVFDSFVHKDIRVPEKIDCQK